MYELIIIGGGPAGVAAGVYAARKRIRTLLITDSYGGQSVVSPSIQNWIGIVELSGLALAEALEKHLKAYAADVLETKEGVRATKVLQRKRAEENDGPLFRVETDDGAFAEARAVILAAGSRRRKLEVPGASQFEGKGIVYCASCDAPLFSGKDVAVIGGGNAGLEAAEQLTAYARSVHILEFGPEFRGDPVTRERVFANPKVTPHVNAETLEVVGDAFVKGLIFRDRASGERHELPVEGIFVEIGSIPNSDIVKGLCALTERGEVIIDHKTGRTSVEGIWAAGDITDQPFKQNNISMGDAVKALEDCYLWLQRKASVS